MRKLQHSGWLCEQVLSLDKAAEAARHNTSHKDSATLGTPKYQI